MVLEGFTPHTNVIMLLWATWMPGNPQLTQVILDDIGTVTDPMISKSDKIGVYPSLKWLSPGEMNNQKW